MARVHRGSRVSWALLALVLALFSGACELVADFDRSRIPEPDAGDGVGGGGGVGIGIGGFGGLGGSAPDGSVAPLDSGASMPDAAPPALDAGLPALDAAAAVDAGLDAG